MTPWHRPRYQVLQGARHVGPSARHRSWWHGSRLRAAQARNWTQSTRACSRFRPDSELWRVNHARGRTIRVSSLLAEAVAVALAAADVTDGDVDPTCGRSLARLGYDRDFAQARQNTSPLSQPAVPAAGWQAVELDRERREIKIPDEVMLDLGATAKALAADRAAVRISASLNCGTLVNLGGDIRVAGEPPAEGWRIGIVDDRGFDGAGAGPAPVTRRPAPAQRRGDYPRRWPGHLVHQGPSLVAGQHPASPHHRAGHRNACGVLAGARSALPPPPASMRTRPARLRSSAANGRPDGWRASSLPARLVDHDGEVVTVAGWPADTAGAWVSTS